MKSLRANPRWKIIKRILLTGLGAALVLTLCAPILVSFVPLPPALFTAPPPAVELLDRNSEPLRLTRDGDRPFQQFAPLSEIPQALVSATLAAEDSRFWNYTWPYPWTDLMYTCQSIYNETNELRLYYNKLPPGVTACLIGRIEALAEQYVPLQSPAIEVQGQKVVFP